MKKLFLTLLLASTSQYSLAEKLLIGFKGQHDQFDSVAFATFAKARNLTPVEFSANSIQLAAYTVNTRATEYEVYGYSLGASSAVKLVKLQYENKKLLPQFITTVGAHKNANLNLQKFGIPYIHFFDSSGVGSIYPGTRIYTTHSTAMQYVNKLYNYE